MQKLFQKTNDVGWEFQELHGLIGVFTICSSKLKNYRKRATFFKKSGGRTDEVVSVNEEKLMILNYIQ